jgi:Ca2+:H+ antiporter
MQALFIALLALTPLTIAAHYVGASELIVFFLSAAAVIPLAKFIGESTEHLSTRTSPALGGFLNATFGNATEFIIGIFALRAGLVQVVQASITGSIIGNLLLVIGLSMVAGGWGREKQSFNKTSVLAAGTTLLLSAIALVVPALYASSSADTSHIEQLSVLVSVAMIIAYIASLYFSLRTHKHLYTRDVAETENAWKMRTSIAVLLASTLAVAWVSEILVGSIEPVVAALGWTQLFIGVIVVAIIGNAAEHASAVTVAMKNRMDLAIQIGMGSATQIALFVAPVLVLASLAFSQPMSLVFHPFEVAAVVVSIFIANFVIADGESNWLEGVQLVLAYIVIGAAFFFLP